MATIRIPPILRPEAGDQREVEVSGATVRALLESLVATYPALQERILAGDELPQFLNVFVDGSDVRLLDGLDTAVSDSTTVILLPAVAGGARPPDAEAKPIALGDDGVAVFRGSVPTERCGPNAAVPVGGATREVRVAVDDAARV
jgi:molybdopterin synthase sulfur carrier subunit